MKKFLLLPLIFLIFSCSKDDNPQKEEINDPIIGSWQGNLTVEFMKNGDETVTENSDCKKRGNITFKEDGTYNQTYFKEVNGECERADNDLEVISESWEKNGEDSYIFKAVYDDGNGQFIQTTEPDKVTFPDNNTMRLFYYESENPDVEYSYGEYNKI